MLFNIQERSVEASSGFFLVKPTGHSQERFVASAPSKHAFPTKIKIKWWKKEHYLGLSKYFSIIYNSQYKTFKKHRACHKAKHPLSSEIDLAYI